MRGRKLAKRIALAVMAASLLWTPPIWALAAAPAGQANGSASEQGGTGQMPAAPVVSTGEGAVGAEAAMKAATYENPHDIIIRAPELTYSTTAKQISIYGACDYDYPLYMNGKQVSVTEKGFFAEYVSLSIGKNNFTFTNNGKSKTVVITRKQAPSGGGGGGTKIHIWGSGVKPKYGTVTGHNISRMASPGTDGEKLLMPLAKGTTAQLTGEAGNLYRLSDGTFVYKSNIKPTEGTLPKSHITAAEFIPLTDKSCTEMRFKIDQNALYNLEMIPGQNRAALTVYNTEQGALLPEVSANKVLKSVTVMAGGSGGGNGANTIYSFNFRDEAPISGYYAEFEDGWLKVGFKHRPVLNGKDLTGVRVYIDAGHGGSDTGSLGAAAAFGPTEKDINLSIALGIQSYLESKNATVLMTRTDDTATGLSDRAYQAAMEKPDLCLSVHCNSMPVTANYNNAKGLLTFYSLDHKDAANVINQEIAENMGIPSKTPRHSNLAMTRMTGYPSVLFETSFMSNPADYQWLIRRDTQETFGLAAGKAVETYIQRIGMQKDVDVVVDGAVLEMEQPPVLKEGRVLVPFRAVFEALGAGVGWEPVTQTVTAEKDGTRVELVIDSKVMKVTDGDGTRQVTLEVPAQITNGRTLVPGRAAAEAFNAEVDWLADSRTVTITTEP